MTTFTTRSLRIVIFYSLFIANYSCLGRIDLAIFLILGYNLAISLAFIAIFKPSTAIDLNHILIFHFFQYVSKQPALLFHRLR